jgi:hypothetical protein
MGTRSNAGGGPLTYARCPRCGRRGLYRPVPQWDRVTKQVIELSSRCRFCGFSEAWEKFKHETEAEIH